MDVYPAIDLRAGKVVRLLRGDYARQTTYGADAAAVAREFVAALILTGTLLAVSVLWTVWRLLRTRSTVLSGPVVAGRIVRRTLLDVSRGIGPPRKTPVLHFSYDGQGQQLSGSVDCSRWGRKHPELQALDVGDEIALIVDPRKPAQTFLRDTFWKA